MLPKQLQSVPGGDIRPNPERDRLLADLRREANWKRWGPYLSERQWGTVREDYSPQGECWGYFTHEQSRSRAYRWGEDGLLGICDRECRLCFSLALWNGKDPILKERLFGLTGPEGNHGEDVKEEYFYLDSTPTHSYMRASYRYPQQEFPYAKLVAENAARSREQDEYELADTGVFAQSRYWDVQAEYAKQGEDDILIRMTISNRGPEAATIHVLPQLWFRNTWSWNQKGEGAPGQVPVRPSMQHSASKLPGRIEVDASHESLGDMRFIAAAASDGTLPLPLFCENETNQTKLFGGTNTTSFVKDGFHERVVSGKTNAVNPDESGTKFAAWYTLNIATGKSVTITARLSPKVVSAKPADPLGPEFKTTFEQRIAEADRFYSPGRLGTLSPEERSVARQAYAGLLWSKQFYHYIVADWIDGDPLQPSPPAERKKPGARNAEWRHLFARDVISMPDKWEYPWFAAWDLAFHAVALSHVDPQFAKDQLLLMMREWYMHPSGAIPAYEFAFNDVNPPVHAWACWRVYKLTGRRGERDRVFLARAFHKLLLNFTWWVNRKDPDGRNVFGGGFLGLDNIGVFDRSKPLPTGGHLEQADGTAWMAFFCGTMLSIALELASEDPAYEDVASKFFEHFIAIVDAMNSLGGTGLWDEKDGFYYDQLLVGGESTPLRVRSLVGIIPILAAELIEERVVEKLPGFTKRMRWFLENRTDLAKYVSFMSSCEERGGEEHVLLAIPSRERLTRVLSYLLDENEFMSPFGIRSMSKCHKDTPYVLRMSGGEEYRVEYVPGESSTGLFGGNSNWRGPIWMPLNYLIIEALERYHHFYGDTLRIPTVRAGVRGETTLRQAADDLRHRTAGLFLPDAAGRRPCMGGVPGSDLLFHEYFHAETGRGLGANHQTGWTALVAPMLKHLSQSRARSVPRPRSDRAG